MRSRGAPVPRTMSPNRLLPIAISRTTSSAQRSPTSFQGGRDRARPTGQFGERTVD